MGPAHAGNVINTRILSEAEGHPGYVPWLKTLRTSLMQFLFNFLLNFVWNILWNLLNFSSCHIDMAVELQWLCLCCQVSPPVSDDEDDDFDNTAPYEFVEGTFERKRKGAPQNMKKFGRYPFMPSMLAGRSSIPFGEFLEGFSNVFNVHRQ